MKVKKKILNQTLIEELMKGKAKIRGMDIKADAEFILKKDGREALHKVKKILQEANFPLEYEKLKSMDFYPGGMRAISLLAIKQVLGYTDTEIEEMGQRAAKVSLIVKIFTKYFGPVRRFFFRESPKIWQKYWTQGEFVPLKLDEKEKYAITQLKNFNLHPVYCTYLKGYFGTFTRLVTGGENIDCQETKCTFKGDSWHEFYIKWQ